MSTLVGPTGATRVSRGSCGVVQQVTIVMPPSASATAGPQIVQLTVNGGIDFTQNAANFGFAQTNKETHPPGTYSSRTAPHAHLHPLSQVVQRGPCNTLRAPAFWHCLSCS